MKLCAIGLMVCSSASVFAQVGTNNAAALSVLQAQGVNSAVAVQQSGTFSSARVDNAGCVPLVVQTDPEVNYIEPKAGYAPSWQKGKYEQSLQFAANSWPTNGDTQGLR